MSLFLPFNFNPTSTESTTGNVTIPSGQYAHVSVTVQNGSSFAVNGTTVMSSIAKDIIPVSFERGTVGNDDYVVPSGYVFTGAGAIASNGGSGRIEIDAADVISSTVTGTSTNSFTAGEGQTVTCRVNAIPCVSSFAGVAVREGTEFTNTFWLKAGDSITGGASLLISYYDIP